jgi:hypothetical protein
VSFYLRNDDAGALRRQLMLRKAHRGQPTGPDRCSGGIRGRMGGHEPTV